MKKSASSTALSMFSVPSTPTPRLGSTTLKRNAASCNALSSLVDSSVVTRIDVEHHVLFMSKIPITQLYTCVNTNAPTLASDEDVANLGTCLASPPEPIEDEEIIARQTCPSHRSRNRHLHQNNKSNGVKDTQ